MPSAVIVGGTGQIGLATARHLVDKGWNVTIVSRSSAQVWPKSAAMSKPTLGMSTDCVPSSVRTRISCALAWPLTRPMRNASLKPGVTRGVSWRFQARASIGTTKAERWTRRWPGRLYSIPGALDRGESNRRSGTGNQFDTQDGDGDAGSGRCIVPGDDPAALRGPWARK